jgi:hypothetical protein
MITITDEQKRMIELQGFMVVEFKLWCKKLQSVMADAIHKLCDVYNAIILFLQDKMLNAFEGIKYLAERIEMESRPFTNQLCKEDDIEKPRFQFVRVLGTKYRCDYARVTIYHCRNNC